MSRQFPSVSAKYGAPMGRITVCHDDTARCWCFRVRFVDGDYDDGGAYWGGGIHVLPLWCVRDRKEEPSVQLFYRARTHKDAVKMALDDYPDLRIYPERKRA